MASTRTPAEIAEYYQALEAIFQMAGATVRVVRSGRAAEDMPTELIPWDSRFYRSDEELFGAAAGGLGATASATCGVWPR